MMRCANLPKGLIMSELYELPNGWEWKKLDDFVTIKGGKRIPKGKKLSEIKTPYPYIRVTDFNDFGSVDLDSIQYVTEDIFKEIKNYIISDKDLYISIAGTIGKTGIIPKELNGANLTENAAKLVFDNEKYDKYYLLYFTNSLPFLEQIGLATKVVAMPKLALVRLKEVYIPLPPLSEQQRIVSKLDLLFAKIDKSVELHQKNMDEADVFMGSVLNEVFGELEEKYGLNILGDSTKTTSCGTPKRNEKSYWDGNIGWLKSGELNDGYISGVEEYITEDGLKKSSAKIFPKGTLLIAMYGATVGKLGILEIETSTNQAICGILNEQNRFVTKYMFYFLRKIREKMLNDSFGGAQPNISQTYIKELELPLPPFPIQQKVVDYLDSVSEKMEILKRVQNDKMKSLKALKASILDKAFRGEL